MAHVRRATGPTRLPARHYGPFTRTAFRGEGRSVGVHVTTRPGPKSTGMRATRQLLLPPKYRRFNLTMLQHLGVNGRVLPRGRLAEAASLPCHARHAAVLARYRPGRAGAGSDAAKPGIAVQVDVSGLCATGTQVCGAGTPKYEILPTVTNARASRLAQCGLVSFRLCCRSLCGADLPKRRFGKAEPTFQRVFWYPPVREYWLRSWAAREAWAIHAPPSYRRGRCAA